jgi:glycine/D-amino acid oxidase-like deaminating enzyme
VVLGATREDAGFDDRVTAGGLGGLFAAAAGLAPGLADATVVETRVGLRPVTPDGLPLLGALTEGLVIAAGNGPEGLTAGPWTGRTAAALALGEQPPADLTAFDPARPLPRPAAAPLSPLAGCGRAPVRNRARARGLCRLVVSRWTGGCTVKLSGDKGCGHRG